MRLIVAAVAILFLLATAVLPVDVFITDDSSHRSATLAGAWRSAEKYDGGELCVIYLPPPEPYTLEALATPALHNHAAVC